MSLTAKQIVKIGQPLAELWTRMWWQWPLHVVWLTAAMTQLFKVRFHQTSVNLPSTRHGTGSLGHRVNGSFGSSFKSGSPGHHFDPVRDPSFTGFRKNAQNAKRTFEMLKWQKSLSGVCCWTEITGCQSMQWTFTFAYDLKNSLARVQFFRIICYRGKNK